MTLETRVGSLNHLIKPLLIFMLNCTAFVIRYLRNKLIIYAIASISNDVFQMNLRNNRKQRLTHPDES